MVDAKSIGARHTGDMFLNIQSAVMFWNDAPRRNYGLVIQVQDSGGDVIDANTVFHSRSCGRHCVNMCAVTMEKSLLVASAIGMVHVAYIKHQSL